MLHDRIFDYRLLNTILHYIIFGDISQVVDGIVVEYI